MVSILLVDPAVRVRFPALPKYFQRKKIVDVADLPTPLLSGQWPKNVDQHHLVLASGKLVLPKKSDIEKLSSSSKQELLISLKPFSTLTNETKMPQ